MLILLIFILDNNCLLYYISPLCFVFDLYNCIRHSSDDFSRHTTNKINVGGYKHNYYDNITNNIILNIILFNIEYLYRINKLFIK